MEKKMGEAVARVARKVNETVENRTDSLDLADCKLMTFPIALYKVMRHVTEGIHLITLANNELKSVTSKFITTFNQLRELNLEGNYIHRLPEEVQTLSHLRVINLSRNKFQHFPEQLTSLKALETINLEENEIVDHASTTASGTDVDPQDHADVTQIQFEIIPEQDQEGTAMEQAVQNPRRGIQPRDPDEIPPDVPLSDLSPSSRLALKEKQRKKVSAMQRVGEAMLRQSGREHREMLESSRREHGQLLALLERGQEEERVMNQNMCSLFKDAVSALSAISACMTTNRGSPTHDRTGNVVQQEVIDDSHTYRRQTVSNNPGFTRVHYAEMAMHPPQSTSPVQSQCSIASRLPHLHGRSQNASPPSVSINTVVRGPRNAPPMSGMSRMGHEAQRNVSTPTTQDISLRRDAVFTRTTLSQEGECSYDMGQEDGSPDFVGTHAWGETPWGSTMSDVSGRKVISGKMPGTPQVVPWEQSSEGDSLTQIEPEILTEAQQTSLIGHSHEISGEVMRKGIHGDGLQEERNASVENQCFEIGEQPSTSGLGIAQGERSNMRSHFSTKTSGGLTSLQGSASLLSSSPREKRCTEVRRGQGKKSLAKVSVHADTQPRNLVMDNSQPPSRSKRVCKPKVIFSPDP